MALAVTATAFSLVHNAKKAVDVLRDYSSAPAELNFVCKLVDASMPVLSVAKALANRHEAIDLLAPPLDLYSETLAEVHRALPEGGGEDGPVAGKQKSEGRSESWNKWLARKKGDVSQRDIIVAICGRLQSCQNLLQLSLTALSYRVPNFKLDAPFVFQSGIQMKAHDFLLEFEFGRTTSVPICFGMLGRRTRSSTAQNAGSSVWEHLYYCKAHLVCKDGKRCALEFQKLRRTAAAAEAEESGGNRDSDSDDDGGDHAPAVEIDEATRFFRYTQRDFRGLEVLFLEEKHDIVYQVENYLLHFERCERISAELFEAIIQMCKLKNGKSYLSQVLSIDKAPEMVKLKEHLAECGPYWEDDGVEATAAEHEVYEKLAKINL